ncbi:MAG: hypothetical protein EB092_07200 [Chitinophagia bacterium]|nr:hypothetical protein [Chitinophagia bacterium]
MIQSSIKKALNNILRIVDTLSRLHYSKSLFPLLLFPLSAIFFLIFFIRKYLYQFNFLKSFKLNVPVIVCK